MGPIGSSSMRAKRSSRAFAETTGGRDAASENAAERLAPAAASSEVEARFEMVASLVRRFEAAGFVYSFACLSEGFALVGRAPCKESAGRTEEDGPAVGRLCAVFCFSRHSFRHALPFQSLTAYLEKASRVQASRRAACAWARMGVQAGPPWPTGAGPEEPRAGASEPPLSAPPSLHDLLRRASCSRDDGRGGRLGRPSGAKRTRPVTPSRVTERVYSDPSTRPWPQAALLNMRLSERCGGRHQDLRLGKV
jgi:hypothetical protein